MTSANNETTKVCITLPPYIDSNGIWYDNAKGNPLEALLPRFELQIVAAFSVSQAFHFLLKRLGIPMIVSQIIAGISLRYIILWFDLDPKEILSSFTSLDILDMVSTLGYILFLFLMGVKMDVTMIHRTGKKTTATAILSLAVPFLLGLVAVERASKFWDLDGENRRRLVIVVVTQSLSTFPVIASVTGELQILNSELGRLGLSCGLVGDMIGLLLSVSTIWVMSIYRRSVKSAIVDLAIMAAYVAVLVFAIRPAMFWVVRQTPEGRPVKSLFINNIIILALGTAFLSHLCGQYVIFGPYILGLAIPNGPPLGSALVDKLDPIVSGLLMPLYVVLCTIRVDLFNLRSDNDLVKSTAVVVAVVVSAKFLAAMIPPLICRVPRKDAIALALIMSSKGIVELTGYTTLVNKELITEGMFQFLFLTVLVTAAVVPILVRFLYDPSRKYAGYQKRNVMHSKANSELPILACIYWPDNIPAIINFLQASTPTRESPVAVYVLHLINLSGQAAPLFISHKMQMKTISNRSYSKNVILSFTCFEENSGGSVSVHPFTAISPTKFMHEDVCMLALDKLTSLVVLPFHRKWFIDGSVESEDNTKRALNRSVLDKSPCSVGILIDRGYLRRFTSEELSLGLPFSVAMIFFGGSDDREALTLAKRMRKNANISLTVVRFISKKNDISTDWERVLDSEVLKDIKPGNNLNEKVEYEMEMVKDGQETSSKIKSMAGKYDLIIIGRRNNIQTSQTSGLDHKLSEFPELGIVGNFLVTKDLPRRYSVLVVQQQLTT